jgi:peptide/nickel transport system ATP-binding protein
VRGVSFTLGRERLGMVGESGSGKSQTGRAILGLTAPGGVVTAKRLEFNVASTCSTARPHSGGNARRPHRDGAAGPKFSLNPVMTIGAQIVETLRAHSRVSKGEGASALWQRWRGAD